jgi:Gpi18-like mannosyltransferase
VLGVKEIEVKVWFAPIWAPFLISRGLIAFSAICASEVVLRPEYIVPFPSILEWPRLLHSALFVADSGFYLWIAQSGYEHGPFSPERQANWAFFPLYPVLVAALGSVLPLSPSWTGIILSNLALAGSLAVLYKVAAQEWGERTANVAVWLLAFFPVSYFLSGFRPEALFLLLTLVSYHECRSGRWWSAGLAGALAAATRPQGVLVVAFILLEGIRQYGWQWRRLLPALERAP